MMKKLILVALIGASPILQARDMTLYLDTTPVLQNVVTAISNKLSVYGSNEQLDWGHWGVQLAFHLNNRYALTAGYSEANMAALASQNPAYTLSFKGTFSGQRLNHGYFFRLGVSYSKGAELYSSDSGAPLYRDYIPVVGIGYERRITDHFSLSGEGGLAYVALFIGYRL